LPLDEQEYFCERKPEDIHRVFEDSLPDTWGMRLLAKKSKIKINRSRLTELLELLSGSGIGALSYQAKGNLAEPVEANVADLEQLVRVAHDVEEGIESDSPELSILFGAGSSPGGARPKVLTNDGTTQWLAKMPSIRDQYSMVPLECAALDLAQNAGLNVPKHKVFECGIYQVLLVERFDIRKNNGRVHLVSMKTLLLESFYHRYDDIAEVIRKISDYPKEDLEHMYRHMVFNAVIGNTDDHVKNYSMQHDDRGWRLTPAYDLLPNVGENTEHALSFGNSAYFPSSKKLLEIGRGPFMLSIKKAQTILDEVYSAVSDWKTVFKQYCVPDKEINQLEKDISKRLSK
jgi:serine/threonine-protein kinase HipA